MASAGPVIVTGSEGPVGRRLRALLPEMIGVDEAEGADLRLDLAHDDFNATGLQAVLAKAGAVLHLHTSADPTAPAESHVSGMEGTTRLVRACGALRVPRLVLAASQLAAPDHAPHARGAVARIGHAIDAIVAAYDSLPGCSAQALSLGWVPHDLSLLDHAPDWLRAGYWTDDVLGAAVQGALGLAR
ncbi:MAG: hypothetical protein GC146_16435 [Limimaricola sp.]|uniref:NAD-dependent epimerase/dehydratase family protein n=1 Tax=Limimaricola sp. TaxID=2211665 RepID=UPI001E0C6E76|nr:NAD-dependent epimerase/dehydratase family protein [Limimaricola sp.]MBI1418805.1 hypothetical protein [Limimaricola sp.]